MRPAPIKRIGDLWRMNSQHDYVKGEENLKSWAPRGVSLVSDFIQARQKRRRVADVGVMQAVLNKMGLDADNNYTRVKELEPEPSPELKPIIPNDDDLLNDTPDVSREPSIDEREGDEEGQGEEETDKVEEPAEEPAVEREYNDEQTDLLERSLKLWKKFPDPLTSILSPANTAPPEDGAPVETALPPSLITTIIRVPKNPKVLKGGYLLVPNDQSTRWVKRFVELRRPYLHIHSATDGDEVSLVSLRNSRVDSQPGVLGLLHGPDDYEQPQGQNGGTDFTPGHRRTASGRVISTVWTGNHERSRNGDGQGLQRLSERMQAAVFAIYGTDNTWLFAARSERDKMDWIFRIDQTYMSNGGSVDGSGVGSPRHSDF